jgi:uncharacterized protein with NRDE domain
MCTVTYLPRGSNNFVLTSNRDENPQRLTTLEPQEYTIGGVQVVFPKDLQAEGTWIASGGNQFTCCLLNGAFEKHARKENYSKSRGLVLLDFFRYNDVEKFAATYDFRGIEPFTLLILDAREKLKLTEIRWNGEMVFVNEKDATRPCIWSSATLYSKEAMHKREKWFDEFIRFADDFGYDILDFHQFAGGGDRTDGLMINRNEKVKTVSITSVEKRDTQLQMTYRDVVNQKITGRNIN